MSMSLTPALNRLNIVRGREYRSDPERTEAIAEALEICVLDILEFLTQPAPPPSRTDANKYPL